MKSRSELGKVSSPPYLSIEARLSSICSARITHLNLLHVDFRNQKQETLLLSERRLCLTILLDNDRGDDVEQLLVGHSGSYRQKNRDHSPYPSEPFQKSQFSFHQVVAERSFQLRRFKQALANVATAAAAAMAVSQSRASRSTAAAIQEISIVATVAFCTHEGLKPSYSRIREAHRGCVHPQILYSWRELRFGATLIRV